MTDRLIRERMLLCSVGLIVGMLGLGTRLGFLTLTNHSGPLPPNDTRRSLLAGRGRIFDRRGFDAPLALNLVVKDICADPRLLAQSNLLLRAADLLSGTLHVPADELFERLRHPERRFAYVKRHIPETEALPVLNLGLPGIFLRDAVIRHYPHGAFMAHVLGFVNADDKGSAGVEHAFDSYLRGSSGWLETPVNARRQELYWRRQRWVPPQEGADIHLTLDGHIQHMVETALDEVIRIQQAAGACCIVQKVRTGEILGLASRPHFDPNAFRFSDEESRLNRAISFVYEPGSTFKVVAISAALNEGIVGPETEWDCENGAWEFGGRTLHDVHPGYGILSVSNILRKSSNIGTAKIALALGRHVYYDYLQRYGIGVRTGIDLPGEETGILLPVHRCLPVDLTRMAIGQSVAVTPIQLLSVFSALANDGFMMRPYVVQKIHRQTGECLYRAQPEIVRRLVSPETARMMRTLLTGVTEEGGTGARAAVEGYSVAGKTGTAQKVLPGGGYSSTDEVASFVGFLPAEEPEIAILVVVDTPRRDHSGGHVAAPVFAAIASQAVRYLEIAPTHAIVARHKPQGEIQPGMPHVQTGNASRWH